MAKRAEAEVVCPHCGHAKKTRAQRGVRLACLGCGKSFRRPDTVAAPPPEGPAPAAGDDGSGPPPGAPEARYPEPDAGSGGFVEVTPSVRQVARPRGRASDAPAPAPAPVTDGEPETEPAVDEDWRDELGPRPPASSLRPKGQRRAQRSGAKGGRRSTGGVYEEFVP